MKSISLVLATLLCGSVNVNADSCESFKIVGDSTKTLNPGPDTSHNGDNGSGNNSSKDDDDVSIKSFYLSLTDGNYNKHTIEKTLEPGQSFAIYGEGKVKNKSSHKIDNVDIDFRIDHGKNFDKRDTKIDEDKPNIKAHKTVTKHTGSVSVKLLSNASKVVVTGSSGSETFDVVDKQATVYFFMDVEGGDDRDISSNASSHNEYGKLVIHVKIPAPEELPANSNGARTVMRFYNSKYKAHFYSTNWNAFIGSKYGDWDRAGTVFNAFETQKPGTVPLYYCWTGSTHDYEIDINKVGDHAPCQEAVQTLFYVYPNQGNTQQAEHRTPVYLMYNPKLNSQILANGWSDVENLRDNHGFKYLGGPLFWAPKYRTLPAQDVQIGIGNDVVITTNGGDTSSDYKNSSCYKAGYHNIEDCMKLIYTILD